MRICWAHLVYNQHSVSRVMQCMFLTFFMHSPYSSLSVEFSISLRPRASLVVQRVKNLPAATWEMQVRSWDRMIPWRRAWQPTPVLLPGEFMDRGAWRATVHGVTESPFVSPNSTSPSTWAHVHGVCVTLCVNEPLGIEGAPFPLLWQQDSYWRMLGWRK